MALVAPEAEAVLEFWLGPEALRDKPAPEIAKRWWTKDAAFDAEIRERFAGDVERAGKGGLEAWTSAPRGRLAVVILLDQFTRNIFRNSAKMYEHDALAVKLTQGGVATGEDRTLRVAERQFLYMPLMHAEDLALQDLCVALFDDLAREVESARGALDFAKRHRDIVAQFGRFPHRNDILGRTSTGDEIAFLQQPGSGF
jgi:uncharacterized protein (DUF924 family)